MIQNHKQTCYVVLHIKYSCKVFKKLILLCVFSGMSFWPLCIKVQVLTCIDALLLP